MWTEAIIGLNLQEIAALLFVWKDRGIEREVAEKVASFLAEV